MFKTAVEMAKALLREWREEQRRDAECAREIEQACKSGLGFFPGDGHRVIVLSNVHPFRWNFSHNLSVIVHDQWNGRSRRSLVNFSGKIDKFF